MPDLIHLHPMLVHFPIALLIVGFLSDLAGLLTKKEFFSKAGFYLLILGTAGVIAAVVTGNLAGNGLTEAGPLKQALEEHEEAGELTLWFMVFTALVRIALVLTRNYRGALKIAAFVLYLVGVALVGRTGYYGGDLVYKHAAGVQFSLGLDFNSQQDTNYAPAGENEDNDDD